ncbi:MAG: S8 family serine peptidase [Bacteroidetes bacterium]|nr:S8 family serine peptidase [Bacteroidota bacterium]
MRHFRAISFILLQFCFFRNILPAQVAQVFQEEAGPRNVMLLLKDKPRPSDDVVLFSPAAARRRLLQGIVADSLDWPLNENYMQQVAALSGVRIRGRSRWMNALLAEVRDSNSFNRIASLPFVIGVQDMGPAIPQRSLTDSAFETAPGWTNASEPESLTRLRNQPLLQLATRGYGMSYESLKAMNGIRLHDLGFRGKGMLIAVLDAGFPGVDRIAAFDSLRAAGRILATRDFVNNREWVYGYSDHGTRVLGCMAANLPDMLKGSAPEASYLLLRTEDADSEWPVETFYWLSAAEFADSMGADIINSSLGYTSFDDPNRFGLHREDLDGKTALISKAARMAASRGMLVLNAAGNEGDGYWERISAPADAPDILSVGATDADGNSASFSGYGPSADGRLKPEVAAPGVDIPLVQASCDFTEGSGTSYATPLLSGLAACLWQSVPRMDAVTLREAIIGSAHRGSYTDPQQGHGIPDFFSALSLLGSNPYFRADVTQLLSEIPETILQDHLFIRVYAGSEGNFRYALFSRGNTKKPVAVGSMNLAARQTGVFRVAPLEHPGPYMMQLSGPGGFSRIYHINKNIISEKPR